MKQIMINETCNGCGMCIVKCPGYFEENADGDAQVISGILADETDAVLKEVLSQCPVHAISDDCKTISDACISCFRCIKICPAHAKNMDNDKSYQEFAEAFSKKLEEPRKNEYFI